MHLAIRLFGSENVTNYKMISMLAGDNLKELIKKCSQLVDDSSFRQVIAKASGCSIGEIDAAFKAKYEDPKAMLAALKALNEVYMKLIEKLPKREY